MQPYNAVMSKRGAQVRRNLERLEAECDAAHPGESMGPVVATRLRAEAWAFERPAKKPTTLAEEAGWVTELREAGYDPDTLRRPAPRASVGLGELSVQEVASRALDRCAASNSAWTAHTVREHATRIMTECGIQATPAEVREFVQVAPVLALEDCFSILPPGAPQFAHVAHWTSVRVMQAETELRDLFTAQVPDREPEHPDVQHLAQAAGLDAGQTEAAAAVASTDPLVTVEGSAGSGKTTMLATAIAAANERDGVVRVVAPTKKAADVAHQALGVPADSVAALVHAHGYRWNRDGVWTRLTPGDLDPETGRTYTGPPEAARLRRGERIVVDEGGMLDQDSAGAFDGRFGVGTLVSPRSTSSSCRVMVGDDGWCGAQQHDAGAEGQASDAVGWEDRDAAHGSLVGAGAVIAQRHRVGVLVTFPDPPHRCLDWQICLAKESRQFFCTNHCQES